MSTDAIAALISGGGFLLSLMMVVFIAGRKDQVIADLVRRVTALEQLPEKIGNIESSMLVISHDLAEIKGMFKLTIKDSA